MTFNDKGAQNASELLATGQLEGKTDLEVLVAELARVGPELSDTAILVVLVTLCSAAQAERAHIPEVPGRGLSSS